MTQPISISDLKSAAANCKTCPLWENATQTVFGEGGRKAEMMLIGEQPGDHEDRSGRPFVGPAGQVLRSIMEEVGLSEDRVYMTNAVKHFKWVSHGKKRHHQKPNRDEILACKPWLEAEIAAVQPKIIVCLGVIATKSILGPSVKQSFNSGKVLESRYGIQTVATIHPSSILRMFDQESRASARFRLANDLRHALHVLENY